MQLGLGTSSAPPECLIQIQLLKNGSVGMDDLRSSRPLLGTSVTWAKCKTLLVSPPSHFQRPLQCWTFFIEIRDGELKAKIRVA